MKTGGMIVALIGAVLFFWHGVKVVMGTDDGPPPFTHHWMSLLGGVLLFIGIWIYAVGRRRARRASGTSVD